MTRDELIDRVYRELPITRWMAEKVVELIIELKEEIPEKEKRHGRDTLYSN